MFTDPLLGTAALVGSIHTLAGPDHYIPFIALARAGNWSLKRCLWVTLLCGLGHIAGSVALGLLGLLLGYQLESLKIFEQVRGDLAAWFLILSGLLYLIWGLYRARRVADHRESGHPHPAVAPWVLFIAFVLGPCEPLVPLLMAPAFQGGWPRVSMVVLVFSFSTLSIMLGLVTLGYCGLTCRLDWMERFSHALAGLAVSSCGLAVALGL